MTDHDNSQIGRWTNEEHQKFLLGLQLYGKNWKKIQQMIVTRNCSQIRSHAQKYFLKLKKTKKTKDQQQNEVQSNHEIQISNEISSSDNVKQQQQSSYSYFMNKIVQFTKSHDQLDIWEAMIDSGSSKETVANSQSEHNDTKCMKTYISNNQNIDRQYAMDRI